MVERIALHKSVPEDLRTDFIEKLAYAYEGALSYALEPDGSAVVVELSPGGSAETAGERIHALAHAFLDRYREVDRNVVFEHRTKTQHEAPIWDVMREKRLVFAEDDGLITFSGDTARVAEALDRLFVKIAHDDFQAVDHRFPTMVPMDAMERCHYFTSFPHHVTFAPHVREDLEIIKSFAGSRKDLDASVATPKHILSPAVCFHAYMLLADRKLTEPTTITACGRCFRYEGKNFSQVERIWDFSMREIIWIGPKDWLAAQRQKSIDLTSKLVTDLGLDAWIESANDPFFINNAAAQRYFQRVNVLKLELRLGLPYSGASLAAASINTHLDFFGKSFAIADGDGLAHTGCLAFGIERWVWALYAQLGPVLADWPAAVRERLGV